MKKLPLDLSKFKKVKSDKNTSTFRHYEGHEITIAHHKLSSKLRDELHKLPTAKQKPQMLAEGSPGVEIPMGTDAEDAQTTQNPTGAPVSAPSQAPQYPYGAPEEAPAPTDQSDQSDQAAAPARPAAKPAPVQAPQAPQAPQVNPVEAKRGQYLAEDQAWAQDLANQHIKPETYRDLFAKKDTLGKISTFFGLMLSGAGSGLTHQPDALLGMMNSEIQNDLEAQKQSKANAQNFLRLIQQQQMTSAQVGKLGAETRNLNLDAQTKSNLFANRAVLHDILSQIDKLPQGSPQRQQGEALKVLLSQAVNSENYNIADRAATLSALVSSKQNQGQESVQDFQNTNQNYRLAGLTPLAEYREQTNIPGFVGRSSAPMGAGEKNELNKYAEFDQQLGRFIDWTKQNSGVTPTSLENIGKINVGKTLARGLQSKYREASLGTVYKPSEQPLLSQTIPDDPTQFLNKWRVIPQLEALRKENMQQLNTAARTKGFQGYSGQAAPGPRYKMSGGIKYMEGPNGEAIKVK